MCAGGGLLVDPVTIDPFIVLGSSAYFDSGVFFFFLGGAGQGTINP